MFPSSSVLPPGSHNLQNLHNLHIMHNLHNLHNLYNLHDLHNLHNLRSLQSRSRRHHCWIPIPWTDRPRGGPWCRACTGWKSLLEPGKRKTTNKQKKNQKEGKWMEIAILISVGATQQLSWRVLLSGRERVFQRSLSMLSRSVASSPPSSSSSSRSSSGWGGFGPCGQRSHWDLDSTEGGWSG